MLDSIYHMTLKYINYCIFGVQTSRFCHKYVKLLWTLFHNITSTLKSVNH